MSSVGPPGSKPPPTPHPVTRSAPGHAPPERRRRLPPAAWVGVALALLAVGAFLGLGGGEGHADEDAIRAAVVRATTASDPQICDELMTDRWLTSNFGQDLDDSVERCRKVNAEESRKASGAEVSSISVEGGTATAAVLVTGGNVGRAELELALVDSNGWRLDELTDIDVDRARYLAAQRKQVGASEVHSDAEPLMRCMLDYAARAVSAAQIETSVLAGNEAFYAGAFPSCVSEFRLMLFSPATIGANTGYSAAELRCIAERANRSISDPELRVLFAAFVRDEPSEDVLADERNAAIARCTAGA